MRSHVTSSSPRLYADCMALSNFMGGASDSRRHGFAVFQLNFHHLLHLIDLYFERATAPLNRKGHLPPGGRQHWIKGNAIAPRRQARDA